MATPKKESGIVVRLEWKAMQARLKTHQQKNQATLRLNRHLRENALTINDLGGGRNIEERWQQMHEKSK